MSARFPMSQRDTAYQPRATLWVGDGGYINAFRRNAASPRMANVLPTNPDTAFLQNAWFSCHRFPGLHPGLVCKRPLGAKKCPQGAVRTSTG
jgi:hypothetical protein